VARIRPLASALALGTVSFILPSADAVPLVRFGFVPTLHPNDAFEECLRLLVDEYANALVVPATIRAMCWENATPFIEQLKSNTTF
jgi:hypothetical protein